jgi:ribosomal subunit interface protein
MQITVTGKQIELSDSLHERVWGELEAIGQRYREREFLLAQVVFRRERRFFICDIGLKATGMALRSQGRAADAYQAFKQAMEPIQQRLAEARSRRYHRRTESTADIGYRSLLRPETEESEDEPGT